MPMLYLLFFHFYSVLWLFPTPEIPQSRYEFVVLGHIQDAGSPHIGCTKACCLSMNDAEKSRRLVASVGIIDHLTGDSWIFDATPDFPRQVELLEQYGSDSLAGIFLTHAHMGHYTGLMYLGREALGASEVSVYGMPRMVDFLEKNGPWSQLVTLKNIQLITLSHNEQVILASDLRVTPLLVPHRDEYSETVGYRIDGPNRSILFIPDINKWAQWDNNIADMVKTVDCAFIDGSFYSTAEINHRPIAEIPHPTIGESMAALDMLSDADKARVYFIHMNHTNPILDSSSQEFMSLAPFRRASFLQRESL